MTAPISLNNFLRTRQPVLRTGATPRPGCVTPFLPSILPGMEVRASLFAASERIVTRRGTMAAATLMPGDEIMTGAGYRRLAAIRPHRAGHTEFSLPGLAAVLPAVGMSADGFRGDLRKLLLVRGARLELISGVSVAILRMSDLFGRVAMRRAEAVAPFAFELRFERPEIIITEQGCFASQQDPALPPCLSVEEAIVAMGAQPEWRRSS